MKRRRTTGRPCHRPFTTDEIQDIVEMRAYSTYGQIANKYGTSVQRIKYICRKHGAARVGALTRKAGDATKPGNLSEQRMREILNLLSSDSLTNMELAEALGLRQPYSASDSGKGLATLYPLMKQLKAQGKVRDLNDTGGKAWGSRWVLASAAGSGPAAD